MAGIKEKNPKIATALSQTRKIRKEVDAADAKGWTVEEYRQDQAINRGDASFRAMTDRDKKRAARYRAKKSQGETFGPGEGA